MSVVIVFCMVILGSALLLALFPAIRMRSWKRFFSGMALSFIGIVFPVLIFLLSAFIIPDWKGGCKFGWIDCFHTGKLALTPLVLWACSAFCVVQIWRPTTYKPWVVLGLFTGAFVSLICFAFGVAVHFIDEVSWWLLVPLYVTLWFWILFIRAVKQTNQSPISYIVTLLGSVPCWVASILISKHQYQSLPDELPLGCFVVTSALRGHEQIVGPFTEIRHADRVRIANRQLMIFWQLEARWRQTFPRTHRAFRKIYNRLGPQIARRIKTPLLADGVYLLLKPLELIAGFIVNRSKPNGE